ncbi:MAG: MaoC family dehydratase N-terminal domain-containing protein [Rhodomicrobiaceae bacterium]
MMKIGDEFSKPHVFALESIRRFAEESGEEDPLHFDEAKAAASRFGGIIASWTTASNESVGLDFQIHFKQAIRAGTKALLAWKVMRIEPHSDLKGDLITLDGQIVDAAGTVYVTCRGHCVLWP